MTTKTQFLADQFHVENNGDVLFGYDEDEIGHTTRTLRIDRVAHADMGCPQTITVTVQPGDHLNAEFA